MKKRSSLTHALKVIRVYNDDRAIDMAKKIGVSASFLSAVELGRKSPPLGFSSKIGKAYNMDDIELEELKSLELEARANAPIVINPSDVEPHIISLIEAILSNQNNVTEEILKKVCMEIEESKKATHRNE